MDIIKEVPSIICSSCKDVTVITPSHFLYLYTVQCPDHENTAGHANATGYTNYSKRDFLRVFK